MPAQSPYDVIVLGGGGVGSAAAMHLAARGARVAVLDQFSPPHDRGSSHGQTRLIRLAYFEHPDYVPLLRRAYELWRRLEEQAGQSLLHQCGLLQVGPPGGVVVPGVLHSARAHGLDVEPLDAEACAERFPGLRLPAGAVAVWERAAGYLLVEECVAACLRLARRLGAEVVLGAAVRRWHVAGRMVVVESDAGPFAADRLVVAAGPWAGELLAELKLPLSVLRKTLVWFASRDDRYQAQRGGPAFLYETPAGYFYGFPQLDPRGVKLAEHSGGEPVADPLAVDRSLRPADVAPVADFARRYLPGLTLQVTDHTVCLYTMTPDGHFVVDRHPQHDQVVLAAGLSGHGFKFASVLGELLSELSLDGQTRLPIGFLAAGRPSLQADA